MGSTENIINFDTLKNKLEKYGITETDAVIKDIKKSINSIINQNKPKQLESEVSGVPLLELYPHYSNLELPSWVINNIDEALIIGTSKQTVLLPDGRKYQLNNKLNHLSGGEWVYFTNSVLNTRYLTNGPDNCAHKIRKIHPTPKPPSLMKDIIEFFTKENEIVLDYFMGVGGTLLGASLCNRKAIGIDLNGAYIDAYKEAAKEMKIQVQPTLTGDSLSILQECDAFNDILNENLVSLVLIDPPYGEMMSKIKTGADMSTYGSKSTPFTTSEHDLGNMNRPEFISSLKKSVELSLKFLKLKGHIVIFIKDLQPHKKDTNLLHADIINTLNSIESLHYKGLRVWADQTSKLFPYGYPFSFVANQIHQYILIFRKEK